MKDAGSTTSTAIIVDSCLLVANVGNSRVVICRGGKAYVVSRDHKQDQSDERIRIEDVGGFVTWVGTWRVGFVTWVGTWRVGGVLVVSPAFGDSLWLFIRKLNKKRLMGHLSFLYLLVMDFGMLSLMTKLVTMIKLMQSPKDVAMMLMHEAS
uniref:PPM-type phosphatase domain-containing protein n=1 Tax=Lactuca sativa TaxID=4236 RepID=A0A9R1XCZ2_LACSA|nr:hypothetical protein LSAT_V11C500266430 [Lactuca sativa]